MHINPPQNFPAVWACAWGEDAYGYWQAFEIKGVRQVMRWIVPGEFLMGSPGNEPERLDNETQHKVLISKGFWMADTACTQNLWQAVMDDNPSDFDDDTQNPVETLSWEDCQEFIEKANQLLGENFLHLPSEEQWEYSCRAGTDTPFNVGENITTSQANYDGNFPYADAKAGEYKERTVPVLNFDPNDWGLFQMHGNVWEWCSDIYQENYVGKQDSSEGSKRVLRGGSWFNSARSLRSAYRYAHSPDLRSHNFGLRLAGGFDPQASEYFW